MSLRRVFIAIGCVLFSPLSQANSSLGEVNIELRGNVVDFTCAVVAGDSNKSVNLGTWPTKQLHAAGDATQPVAFSLKLEGCPPGSASITCYWTRAPGAALLARADPAM
ncbi:fimbriae assembly protein, partial [Salmonella enterica subsp. enterica serovar Poona]